MRAFLPFFLFLAVLSPCWSMGGEKTYTITESELNALESAITQAQTALASSTQALTELKQTLTMQEELLTRYEIENSALRWALLFGVILGILGWVL